MLRSPAVAGRFYPARPEILREDLERYVVRAAQPIRAIGCVVPHAGYMYSGAVAGEVYGAIDLPSSFIVLCPNHTGLGESLAMCAQGEWLTPLGRVPVDAELARLVLRECGHMRDDPRAHAHEHALEVQLPFLQHAVSTFTFVPIALGGVPFERLEELGEGLARAIAAAPKPVLLVASSDMNHYEPDSLTRAKDHRAIDQILKLEARGLYDVLHQDRNTMCGYGPVIVMLTAAKKLGASRATLVRYATSADAGGPRDAVVGYAGIVVY
jgi:hypothetical protein